MPVDVVECWDELVPIWCISASGGPINSVIHSTSEARPVTSIQWKAGPFRLVCSGIGGLPLGLRWDGQVDH